MSSSFGLSCFSFRLLKDMDKMDFSGSEQHSVSGKIWLRIQLMQKKKKKLK